MPGWYDHNCVLGNHTISSHEFFRYVLSARPYLTTLATRDCCRAFGSSTMVDPLILKTGWGSLCGLLLLMLPLSCTLVGARLFPHQLTTKWSITLLICRCCTPCTTGGGISTLSHRSQLNCWLLSTLLMSDWHDFRALSGDFERELQEQYFSPSEGENSTSSLTPHQSRDEETQSSVPMLLATGTTTVPLIFQCHLRRSASVLPHHARYDVAASSSSVVKLQRRFFQAAPTLLTTVTHPIVPSALQCFVGKFALFLIDRDHLSTVRLPNPSLDCEDSALPLVASTPLACPTDASTVALVLYCTLLSIAAAILTHGQYDVVSSPSSAVSRGGNSVFI